MVYLDNNSTTPLHPAVKQKIIDILDIYGNPSSVHQLGRVANGYLKEARQIIADFFHCLPEEIVFTASGSEANNTIVKSCIQCCQKICNIKKHIITSVIEHPSVLNTLELLEQKGEIEVTYVEVDSYGIVDPAEIERAIRPETVLISIMYVNNEIGTIQPIQEIGEIAHRHSILFHTDAVQAIGKLPIDLSRLPVDFLSASGHKVYAPKGVGFFFKRDQVKQTICPLIAGGHQENSLRAGTENTIGIIALGEAFRVLKKEMKKENERVLKLRKRLEEEILREIPYVHLNGHPEKRVSGCTNISFEGIEGESILLRLDLMGIAVSTGSACSSGSLDPSPVIMAIGHDSERAHGSIRFSLGRENTEAEIDYTIRAIKEVVESLRKISPVRLS